MYQYLERKEFGSAYTTGCLGVTESDWRSLGREALDALDLDVATKAYTRLKASVFFLLAKLSETLALI
jgi:intraflagellar transport protein 122